VVQAEKAAAGAATKQAAAGAVKGGKGAVIAGALGAAAGMAGDIDPNSTSGKVISAAGTAAADAIDIAQIASAGAGNIPGLVMGIMGIASRHPVILWSLVAIALAPLLSLGVWLILFAVLLNGPGGNIPQGNTSVASSVSTSSWANPNGEYPSEMTPTLAVEGGKTLVLESTSGGYSCEDNAFIDASGAARLRTTGEPLSISPSRSRARKFDGTTATQEEIDYYITARFPYVLARWNGTTIQNPQRPAGARMYWGRKMVIYSPQTKQGVVVIPAEYGPAAWTGIAKNPNDTSSSSKVRQQYQAWVTNSTNGGRAQTPEGYTGRIAGGGDAVSKGLGFPGASTSNCDKPIVIGFLKDQNAYPVGHIFQAPKTTSIPGVPATPTKPRPQE
jgi:hypothetical protein